jgi:DNA-binding HxlR family transcriptional regulator
MYEKKIPVSYDCGISVAIKVLGGKWSAWMIDCINRGVRRPSEIHEAMHEANPRVLNMLLRELTDIGIFYKKIYQQQPLKVEYYLTDLGKSILPVLEEMDKWGNKNRASILSAANGNRTVDAYESN